MNDNVIAAAACGPETSRVTRFQFRTTGPKDRRHKCRHTVIRRSYTTQDQRVLVDTVYTDEREARTAHYAWFDTHHATCTGSGCLVPSLTDGQGTERP